MPLIPKSSFPQSLCIDHTSASIAPAIAMKQLPAVTSIAAQLPWTQPNHHHRSCNFFPCCHGRNSTAIIAAIISSSGGGHALMIDGGWCLAGGWQTDVVV
ncbi:unnamed protein product [Cuscuta europaea]|uniref:Uncharacterized protein n=1 Tax=Cuscuta europaea TaxID=41803 RepID=A0A9P1EE42_CUSEU|nr:unnamed protein product [Cuscuta europaea]